MVKYKQMIGKLALKYNDKITDTYMKINDF